MNKEEGKLYDKFLSYVFRYIPSDGDGRLECEGMLVDLLDLLLNKWIKCSDELPINEMTVFIYSLDSGICGIEFGDFDIKNKIWRTFSGKHREPTHWQHIEPPKDKQ